MDKDNKLVSIWESGIQYGNFNYDSQLDNTVYGFDGSDNKNYNQGDDTKRWESVKRKDKSVKKREKSVKSDKPPKYTPRDTDDIHAPTWTEFTSTTTFHGMKYVFDGNPMNVRRLLWTVIVVTAVVLFSIQVVNRVSDFFDRNTNTNVEVQYQPKIPFPTVTLCNQNTYRITATVNRSLYDFIDQAYGVNGFVDTDSGKYDLDSHNYTEFILASAHQLEDFIDSCRWKGTPCNISLDFKTTVTEFGVCYTFNGDLHNQMTITHAGAGFGLSLILNIEQYEYMTGPQDEAGIKMLLHNATDTPLVKELGFAIAPGTHTLVGVNREEVITLESPYGSCVKTAKPRSQCITECRTERIVEHCGCRDVYMPPVNNAQVCNMSTAYTCVVDGLADDDLNRNEEECDCPVPCEQVNYEPDLSYSHLSKLTVDRISLSDEEKLQAVQNSFRYARELSQRVNKIIAERDREWLTGFLNDSVEYHQAIVHSHKVLEDIVYLDEMYNVSHAIYVSYATMSDDFDTINLEYQNKFSVMSQFFPDLLHFKQLESEVNNFLDMQDGVSPLRMRLQECYEEQFITEPPPSTLSPNQTDTPPLKTSDDYYVCDDSKSGTYLSYRKTRLRYVRDYFGQNAINLAKNMEEDYGKEIDYLFTNTSRQGREKPEFAECIEILNEMSETWLESLEEVHNLSVVYNEPDTDWETKIYIADRMILFSNATAQNGSLIYDWVYEPCNWYLIGNTATPHNTMLGPSQNFFYNNNRDRNYSLFQAHTSAAGTSYFDAQSLLTPLISQGKHHALQYQIASVGLFENAVEDYLSGDSTKLDLHNHFDSQSFKVGWEELTLAKERYMEDYRQYLSKILDMENNIWMSMSYAFDFVVPVMNDTVIDNLALVSFARERSHKSSVIAAHLANLTTTRKQSVLGLVTAIYGDYRLVMQNVQSDSLMSFQQIDDGVTDLQDELTEFSKENEINDEFFMENYIKIDIFYKDLSYELIQQQVTFEFLSLLSEIGGFMGLLLGASVLTVCEMIDYLSLNSIRKCRNSPKLKYSK